MLKTWSLYTSLGFLILLVLITIHIYYAGSTPQIRYYDLKTVINFLVNKGVPVMFGFFIARLFQIRR